VDELYYDQHLPKLLYAPSPTCCQHAQVYTGVPITPVLPLRDCLEHLEKRAAETGFRLRKPSGDQVLRQQLQLWGIKQRIPFLGPAHRRRCGPPTHPPTTTNRSPPGETRRASQVLAKWPVGVRRGSTSSCSSPALSSKLTGSFDEEGRSLSWAERTAAAVKIQSVFRMWHARRIYKAKGISTYI
jgi:hypothetical protein